MPALEKEQVFWNLNRARSFQDLETKEELFQFYQYRAAMKSAIQFYFNFLFFSRFPRPESYREDMELVKGLETDAEREQMWSNVASAAETGWDFRFILIKIILNNFSTRWFAQEGPGMHDMK